MKVTIFLFYIIGILSPSLNNTPKRFEKHIYGDWEYHKVFVEKKWRNVEPDSCGHKDFLSIEKSDFLEKDIFGPNVSVKGYRIGISNTKICQIHPANYEYQLEKMSCPTYWTRLHDKPKNFIRLSEGVLIEYKIKKLNKETLVLQKVREIENYGLLVPDKILFKKKAKVEVD